MKKGDQLQNASPHIIVIIVVSCMGYFNPVKKCLKPSYHLHLPYVCRWNGNMLMLVEILFARRVNINGQYKEVVWWRRGIKDDGVH